MGSASMPWCSPGKEKWRGAVEWVGDPSGRLLWRRGMVRVTSESMGREKEQDPEDTLAVE